MSLLFVLAVAFFAALDSNYYSGFLDVELSAYVENVLFELSTVDRMLRVAINAFYRT